MIEFLWAYGLFLAKVLTGLFALVVVISLVSASRRQDDQNDLKITNLNQKYEDLKQRLLSATLSKKAYKEQQKQKAKEDKKLAKDKDGDASDKAKMYVLEFEGDIKATEVVSLRDEITAVLSVVGTKDEVFLKLDNSGGIVHEHGLAASQMKRITDAGIKLTVSVDKVAASGGYMMACVANKIIAAPFAILGSIGVVAQLPNFNRLLDRAGIDFEQHTAGKYKRTLTMFGKNGKLERDKLKQELEETHVLFQGFVTDNRPNLDIEKVATGEHWYGTQALNLGLVDEIKTSDQFLLECLDDYDLYQVEVDVKKGLQDRLIGGFLGAIEQIREALAK